MKPIFLELNHVLSVNLSPKNEWEIRTGKVIVNLNELSHFRPAKIENTEEIGTELYLHNSIVLVLDSYMDIQDRLILEHGFKISRNPFIEN